MSKYFAFTAAPVRFNHPGLGSSKTFLIRPITQADYEQVGTELFRHNIVPISQDTFRAHFIDELYNLHPEEVADEKANILDEFWQADDLFAEANAKWQEQEEQRLLDMEHGAPKRLPAPKPQHTMAPRARSIASILADETRRASRKIRDLSIEQQTYAKRQQEGMARVVLCGWEGFETKYEQDETLTITTDEAFQALKREINDQLLFAKLMQYIMAGGIVEEEERGNSDLLPGTELPTTGSPEPSGASETSDGTSTASSITPAPSEGSVLTTQPSSTSTSNFGGNTLTSGGHPMDAR